MSVSSWAPYTVPRIAGRTPGRPPGRPGEDRWIARRSASMSFSRARSATPDCTVCVTAPPKLFLRHDFVVTVFTTSGPVTNMYELSFTTEDEIRHCRAVHRTARARAHDQRLGRQGKHVALEHFGIAAGLRALHGHRAPPRSLRPAWPAPTFSAMSITLQIFWAWRQATAEDREVLAEHINKATIDRARSGDDAIAQDLRFASMPKSTQLCSDTLYRKVPQERAFVGEDVSRSRAVGDAAVICRVDALLSATHADSQRTGSASLMTWRIR